MFFFCFATKNCFFLPKFVAKKQHDAKSYFLCVRSHFESGPRSRSKNMSFQLHAHIFETLRSCVQNYFLQNENRSSLLFHNRNFVTRCLNIGRKSLLANTQSMFVPDYLIENPSASIYASKSKNFSRPNLENYQKMHVIIDLGASL